MRCACSWYAVAVPDTLCLFAIRCACSWYAVPVHDTLCLFPIRCACSWYAVPVPITVDWLFVVPLAPTNWILTLIPLYSFSIGLSWIVNSSAENFHLWTALQKMSNISLEGFYWYKDNLSGRRFFGENFQVPRNKDLAFESSLFLVTMTSTTATSEAKNKLAVTRS